MEKSKSKRGFTNAMLALILFILAIIIYASNEDAGTLVGVLELVACVVAIIGLVNSVRGLSEPNSMEQIVGITVNGIFALLLIGILVAAIIQM